LNDFSLKIHLNKNKNFIGKIGHVFGSFGKPLKARFNESNLEFFRPKVGEILNF
jgi:hypothetical protein